MRWVLLFSLAAVALPRASEAATYRGTPSNYRELLPRLGPGDVLELAAGDYLGLPVHNLHGAAGTPITITGPVSGAPAVILGHSTANTISILDSSHVVIQHLTLDIQGHAVDGVKAEGHARFAHDITLFGLKMSNFGRNQQVVGISTKCPAWDWTIKNNEIRGAGTGLYLGNSDGTGPFIRGTIEHNLVVDPIGYGMEIKHQVPRPSLSGMPTGQSVTFIRHNVFTKAAGASTGGNARPNLLVGAFPASGPGASDRYEIYGNLLYENASRTEGLFQGEGNLAFHDNLLVNTFGSGVLIRRHNGEPREISVYNNTIVVAGTGIAMNNLAAGYNQYVVGNAIFAGTPLSGGGLQRDNVEGALAEAALHLTAPAGPLGILDLYPRPGALEGPRIDLTPFAQHTEADLDFNGSPKSGTFRGAYSGAGTNPGWALTEAVKVLPGEVPVPDAGIPDAAAPPADAAALDAAPADAGGSADAGFDDRGFAADASAPSGGSRAGTRGGCTCAEPHRPSLFPASLLALGAVLGLRRRREA